MHFLIAIHKDPDSDYGVTVPDLPGCFSAGSTLAEALAMAKEAIELYLECLLDDGHELPTPHEDVAEFRRDTIFSDAIWAVVAVDVDWRAPADRLSPT